eukprot:JP443406.1.p3 GENE.JP443406.1~~JP443406.1.p3  ORF type:complete len:62 (+),score=39.25 JP443406.1:1-186(+)
MGAAAAESKFTEAYNKEMCARLEKADTHIKGALKDVDAGDVKEVFTAASKGVATKLGTCKK